MSMSLLDVICFVSHLLWKSPLKSGHYHHRQNEHMKRVRCPRGHICPRFPATARKRQISTGHFFGWTRFEKIPFFPPKKLKIKIGKFCVRVGFWEGSDNFLGQRSPGTAKNAKPQSKTTALPVKTHRNGYFSSKNSAIFSWQSLGTNNRFWAARSKKKVQKSSGPRGRRNRFM